MAKNDPTKQTLRFFWKRASAYPKFVIGVGLSVPLAVLLSQTLPPLILASVLNRLARHDFISHNVWASFGPELVAYAILAMFGGVIGWRLVDSFMWRLEGNVESDIAQGVFSHLLEQSASFHANRFGGSMVSHTNKLMGSYIRVADTTVFQVMPLVLGLLFASIVLLHRAPLFVIALVSFAVVYMVSAFFVTRPVRRLSARQAAAESDQTGYLADMITNVMAVKSFARGNYERHGFAKKTRTTHGRLLDIMRANMRQQAYFGSMTGLIGGASLTLAVISVVVFDANVATVFLILNYTASITNQLFQFSNNSIRTYNRALGDAKDMVEILQIQPEVQDNARPEKVRIGRGLISFDDVTFSHDGAGDAIFENFNLTIQPGEKVGLVGHSGSGKTTFTRLLLRFSDIQAGRILIDGQDIAAIRQNDLRSNIAYVPQEPLLFHRSISENIAYGKPGATMTEIAKFAKLAHADEFIRTLPKGYDTLVGERGVKLSGGQRQRIAIARAMIKHAPILVLDEATSALDSESERLIQSSLKDLMKGRTAIVIAHRLSTIQRMDRIVVLEDGHIVEQGSHKELLAQNGTYAKLWAHQSGGFIDE